MKKILPVLFTLLLNLILVQVMSQSYVPITISSGFNTDLIADGTLSTAAGSTSGVGMDGGGNVFFGVGFTSSITGSPGCVGLPHTITVGTTYKYSIPSFTANNCILMRAGYSSGGDLIPIVTGTTYQSISLLASSANTPDEIGLFSVSVYFQGIVTPHTVSFTVPDWTDPVGTYSIANYYGGKVHLTGDVYSNCPGGGSVLPVKLYNCVIDLTEHSTQVITKITITRDPASTQNCAVFAVCGVTAANAPLKVITDPASPIGNVNFDAKWHPDPASSGLQIPDSYRLDVATDPDFNTILPAYNNLDVGSATTWPVTGLSPSTNYYYRVRGVNNTSGVGPSSDPRLATTINNAPLPITATDADPVLGTKFDAHWSPTSPDPNPPTSYRLDVATDLGFSNILPAYNNLNVGNVTTFTVEGLTILSTYYYRVRGVNSNGTTASSNVITVHTTNGLPPAPVATPATAVIQINFWAHWNAGTPTPSEPVDCYYLDVATDIGFSNILPAYNNLNVGLNTMFKITGLTAGTTYYYRVRAHNEYGLSDNSNVITVITVPSNIPTLSEWGLIILGLVLLGAGTLYITRWHS